MPNYFLQRGVCTKTESLSLLSNLSLNISIFPSCTIFHSITVYKFSYIQVVGLECLREVNPNEIRLLRLFQDIS